MRWLVTDLDGTLVDRNQRLVPRSTAALARYRDAGGTVLIATGRNERSAGRYHAALGLDTPMILYNGARVVDPVSGARLLDRVLSPAASSGFEALLPELPVGVGVLGFRDEDVHVLCAAPALAGYARRDGVELAGPPPDSRLTKVMLIAPGPGLATLADLIAAHVPGVRLVQSEDTYLEVLPAGTGKGDALRFLAGRMGVDLRDVAAIGDNPNDIDLVGVAGLGVAVGDGHPDVRAAADVVVGPCAGGAVADLVELLLSDQRASA